MAAEWWVTLVNPAAEMKIIVGPFFARTSNYEVQVAGAVFFVGTPKGCTLVSSSKTPEGSKERGL